MAANEGRKDLISFLFNLKVTAPPSWCIGGHTGTQATGDARENVKFIGKKTPDLRHRNFFLCKAFGFGFWIFL
jgi:hypothetical protein